MVDEYTDISNKELVSMCCQWIKDLRVHENIAGYYELPDVKSDTIFTAIKESVIRMQPYLNDLRTQAQAKLQFNSQKRYRPTVKGIRQTLELK